MEERATLAAGKRARFKGAQGLDLAAPGSGDLPRQARLCAILEALLESEVAVQAIGEGVRQRSAALTVG